MKRFLTLTAALLICLMAFVPCVTAFATDEGSSGDISGDGEMTITSSQDDLTVGASPAQIDYSQYTLNPSITDGEGKATRSYSTGLGCGAGGLTLFTNHQYIINFDYSPKENAPVAELVIEDCDPEMQAKYVNVDGGSVHINTGDEPFSMTIVLLQNGEPTGTRLPLKVSKYKVDLTDVLIAAIGVYALITAITGKGNMFRNDFIKEGKEEQYKKLVRIASAVIAIAMLGVAAISIFGVSNDSLNWVKYTLFGIGLAALIATFVISGRFTDKEKRAKAVAGGPAPMHNSSAAFEFDDDEPTLDDVLAKIDSEKAENNDNN